MIPGNHDHMRMFNPDFQYENYKFPHFKFLEIFEGLFITGMGGAPPGYDIKDEAVWEGFPWNSQEEMTEYVKKYEEKFSESIKNNQFIFMTHCGGYSSGTSQIFDKGEKVFSGCRYYDEFIRKYQDKIVYQTHGHSHTGMGISPFDSISVINPGSLSHNQSLVEV